MFRLWFGTVLICHVSRTSTGVIVLEGSLWHRPCSGVEYAFRYRRIPWLRDPWDTTLSPATNQWKGRAGIVSPLDSSGIPVKIHAVTGDRFKSEAEARDYVLKTAAEWVDERLEGVENEKRL
jgi:hypothetical protein